MIDAQIQTGLNAHSVQDKLLISKMITLIENIIALGILFVVSLLTPKTRCKTYSILTI